MQHSIRGAALVSLTWVIALAVLFLGTLGFTFLQTQKMSDLNANIDGLQTQLSQSQTDVVSRIDDHTALTKVVGFAGNAAGAQTDIEAIRIKLEEIGSTFTTLGPDVSTVEEALTPMLTEYNGLVQSNHDQTQQIARLRADLDARQQELGDIARSKDQEIRGLRSAQQDLQNSTSAQIVDLERQRDALRDRNREIDARAREAAGQADDVQRALSTELDGLKQRNDVMSAKYNRFNREPDKPDGRVLSVSVEVERAWIDLGRYDRLRRGMEFRVQSGSTGVFKGTLRVLSLNEKKAECQILEVADRFNMIAPGDSVSNPLYDAAYRPAAVLLGNGFGRYSQTELAHKLEEIGISVRNEVAVDADLLILGARFFDEDTGEEIPWDQNDTYVQAEAMSLKVVSQASLLSWLGL